MPRRRYAAGPARPDRTSFRHEGGGREDRQYRRQRPRLGWVPSSVARAARPAAERPDTARRTRTAAGGATVRRASLVARRVNRAGQQDGRREPDEIAVAAADEPVSGGDPSGKEKSGSPLQQQYGGVEPDHVSTMPVRPAGTHTGPVTNDAPMSVVVSERRPRTLVCAAGRSALLGSTVLRSRFLPVAVLVAATILGGLVGLPRSIRPLYFQRHLPVRLNGWRTFGWDHPQQLRIPDWLILVQAANSQSLPARS